MVAFQTNVSTEAHAVQAASSSVSRVLVWINHVGEYDSAHAAQVVQFTIILLELLELTCELEELELTELELLLDDP